MDGFELKILGILFLFIGLAGLGLFTSNFPGVLSNRISADSLILDGLIIYFVLFGFMLIFSGAIKKIWRKLK